MTATTLIDLVLLSLMCVTAVAIVRVRDLFAVAMLLGIFSLLCAGFFVTLDAVDVAFTEAAVGAGVSTLLMLSTLSITQRKGKTHSSLNPLALVVVILTGLLLVYGTWDMPHFGDQQAPIHQHVGKRYLEESEAKTGMPNVVTSVLASYRGYDTMGELAVIFTAGVGVILLLGRPRRKSEESEEEV